MANGELTAKAARELSKRLAYPGFEVLFDHGDTAVDPLDRVGNISSWYGDEYSSKTQLALLDIAVVDQKNNRTIVLVEIEESSSNPKVLIGDAFATLLGDQISFQGTRRLSVGNFTSLYILLRHQQPGHNARIDYLQEKIVELIAHGQTGNSAISQIVFDPFRTEAELINELTEFVNSCIASYLEVK